MNLRLFPLVLILGAIVSQPVFADGRMEEARKAFFDVAQKSYFDTVKNLESNNTKAAEVSAKQFHQDLDRLENPLLYIEKDMPSIDEKLKSTWEAVMKLFGNVRTSAGLLENKIGTGSTSSELSTLKDYFLKFGEQLNRAYDEFKTYGKVLDEKSRKFQTLCDTCR